MSCGRPNSCSYTPCRRSRCSMSGPGKPHGDTATRSLLSISVRATLAFRSARASSTVRLPMTRMARHVMNWMPFMNMYQWLARRYSAQPLSSRYALSERPLSHSRAAAPPLLRTCAVCSVNGDFCPAARARNAATAEAARPGMGLMRARCGMDSTEAPSRTSARKGLSRAPRACGARSAERTRAFAGCGAHRRGGAHGPL